MIKVFAFMLITVFLVTVLLAFAFVGISVVLLIVNWLKDRRRK